MFDTPTRAVVTAVTIREAIKNHVKIIKKSKKSKILFFEKSFLIDSSELRSACNQVFVEYQVIRPGKKAKKDLLLSQSDRLICNGKCRFKALAKLKKASS